MIQRVLHLACVATSGLVLVVLFFGALYLAGHFLAEQVGGPLVCALCGRPVRRRCTCHLGRAAR